MNRSICHISPLSIHSTRWIEAFREKGYNISLITDSQTWAPQKPRNIPIYVLPTLTVENFGYTIVRNCASIARILRKTDPHLIQLHTQYHYAFAIAPSHIPYILHSWGGEVLELSNMNILRKFLAKYVTRRAGRIVVDAECMKKIWKSTGISQRKIEIVPFGVDTTLFNPQVKGRNVRRKLGIREEDIVVISTRPFFTHYDIECLINAIPLVVNKNKNIKFIVKGKGPKEVRIRELAKKLGVDRYIRFTSPVPYPETSQYLAASDIYVSTSFIDSTSVSLLEAMACGLPPITTDIPGNREWIRNETNGLLYPPRDYNALAQKITQLVENEDQRKSFGEVSHRTVIARGSWEQCISKMETIYDSMIRA